MAKFGPSGDGESSQNVLIYELGVRIYLSQRYFQVKDMKLKSLKNEHAFSLSEHFLKSSIWLDLV